MKHTMTPNKTKIKNLAYLLILLIIVILNTIIQSPGGGFLWASPVVGHSSSVAEIWSLSEIYINTNLQPLITALDNKLIVMGSDDLSQRSSIMAFEGDSGDVIWRVPYDGISISSTASKVIVGGAGQVMALDGETGSVLWNTFVRSNVTRIIPRDDRLYIFGAATNRYYILEANRGNILDKLEGTYTIDQEPSLGNIAYLRDGNGGVFAVNKLNGQEVWRNEANAISNLAVTPSFVYALSQDGNVLRLDSQTGYKESLPIFTSAPFILSSEQTVEFPFYVTVDTHTNILFVYLGDSAQLFAFQLPN